MEWQSYIDTQNEITLSYNGKRSEKNSSFDDFIATSNAELLEITQYSQFNSSHVGASTIEKCTKHVENNDAKMSNEYYWKENIICIEENLRTEEITKSLIVKDTNKRDYKNDRIFGYRKVHNDNINNETVNNKIENSNEKKIEHKDIPINLYHMNESEISDNQLSSNDFSEYEKNMPKTTNVSKLSMYIENNGNKFENDSITEEKPIGNRKVETLPQTIKAVPKEGGKENILLGKKKSTVKKHQDKISSNISNKSSCIKKEHIQPALVISSEIASHKISEYVNKDVISYEKVSLKEKNMRKIGKVLSHDHLFPNILSSLSMKSSVEEKDNKNFSTCCEKSVNEIPSMESTISLKSSHKSRFQKYNINVLLYNPKKVTNSVDNVKATKKRETIENACTISPKTLTLCSNVKDPLSMMNNSNIVSLSKENFVVDPLSSVNSQTQEGISSVPNQNMILKGQVGEVKNKVDNETNNPSCNVNKRSKEEYEYKNDIISSCSSIGNESLTKLFHGRNNSYIYATINDGLKLACKQTNKSLLALTLENINSHIDIPTFVGGDCVSSNMNIDRMREKKLRNKYDYENMDNDLESLSTWSRITNNHGLSTLDDLTPQYPLVKKRVKVVQLIVFGILGVFGGFLGTIFVQYTCHYGTGFVTVGNNQEEFELHVGLWKYSSIDSVFNDYPYCSPYNDDYSSNAPMISRGFGIVAIVTGSFSLAVLWTFLIIIYTSVLLWSLAVRMALIASISQLLTLFFFRSHFCLQNQCGMGPGSLVAFISSVAWFCMAYEMHHNSPILAMVNIGKPSVLEKFADKYGLRNLLVTLGFLSPVNDSVPTLSKVAKAYQPPSYFS